jgi:uncharacterized protein (TIGR02001 family)
VSLRIIICSIVFLLPTFAYGEFGGKEVSVSSTGEEEGGSQTSGQDSLQGESPSYKWVNLSGNFQLVTDYMARGQTQTYGGPAAQGSFILSQKKNDGFYVGVFGSNVSSVIPAPNGSGLELNLFAGYIYKKDHDLSFGIELCNTRYPGARASLPLNDKFDYLEIIPNVTYKIFSASFAYSISDRSGVNQNFAPTFPIPLKPNGNSRGSWYAEASANMPVSFINNNLKFRVLWGYWYARNYTVLNYAVFGTGLKYKLPENCGAYLFLLMLALLRQTRSISELLIAQRAK